MSATFARHGARVAIADVAGDRAAERAAAIAGEGRDALAVTMDIASEASVADGFAAVTAQFGGVDILVNNAMPPAAAQDGPVCDLSLDAWNALLGGGLGGALLCSRHAIPIMTGRGGGSIVN